MSWPGAWSAIVSVGGLVIAGFFFGRLAGGVEGGSILVLEDLGEDFFVSVRRCFLANGLDAFASAFEPEIEEVC